MFSRTVSIVSKKFQGTNPLNAKIITRNLVACASKTCHKQDIDAKIPFLGLQNCVPSRRQISISYRDFAGIGNVVYEEVKSLPNHPEKLLVDVREPEELKELGKIPSSINIPLANVVQELGKSVDASKFKVKYGREKPSENTEIIFSCLSGKRALKAAEAVSAIGFKDVKVYEGSWKDWAKHEGLPQ